jgi:ABC-type sugar transport system ATPase subunit
MNAILRLENVGIDRDGYAQLQNIDLLVPDGSTVALVGPSGGGKTTLLRVIMGLEVPTRGTVEVAGRQVAIAQRILVAAEQRRTAMVFQDLGLWPHMSVADHVEFALASRKYPKDRRSARRREILDWVGLAGRERQRPGTLSGGERQRVAIARALATDPLLLLFDEPLANLDVMLKCDLIALFRRLLAECNCTTIYVTHDPYEALALTDQLVVLEQGRITQCASFAALAAAPATPFVQALVEAVQRLPAAVNSYDRSVAPPFPRPLEE